MAPMIDVDLETLQQEDQKRWPDDEGEVLERAADQSETETDENRRSDESQEHEAAEPAVGGECVHVGGMWFEIEPQAKPQRPEAVRPIEQHGQRMQLIDEARIIIFLARRLKALKEKLAHRIDRQDGDEDERTRQARTDEPDDDAPPHEALPRRHEGQADHRRNRDKEGPLRAARERQENAEEIDRKRRKDRKRGRPSGRGRTLRSCRK